MNEDLERCKRLFLKAYEDMCILYGLQVIGETTEPEILLCCSREEIEEQIAFLREGPILVGEELAYSDAGK